MHKYELMYVVQADTDADALKGINERLQGIITDRDGSVDSFKEMGKKRFAYEINKQREGIYMLLNFTSNADAVAELSRVINITEKIVRYIVLNLDDVKVSAAV